MTYLLLFILIILNSSISRRIKTGYKEFIIYSVPIFALLVLILGLQDNVGADYGNYLSLVDGTRSIGSIERKSEFLFIFLINLVKYLKNPQLIFVITALIQTCFLMLITYKVKKLNYRLDIFFFLYFTLSITFFNQFNGIRQYIAVYIMVYATLQLMDKKNISFIIFTVVAGLFHSSAYFLLPILLFQKIIKIRFPRKFIIMVLLGLLLISFVNLDSIYDKILTLIPQYSRYIHSNYMQRLSLEGIITKIPKLAIVVFSILNIDYYNLQKKEVFLVNLSFIACAVMILSFTSTIIWRFYQYFDMYLIFPVMILMHDKSKKTYSGLIAIILIVMLITKIIIMPRGEYLYNSILF